MKQKYNEELIINFINSDNLGNYSQDFLTKNVEFMISVFEYTHSTAWYSICDNSIKNDYNFNKYLIDNFSYDENFINHLMRYVYDNIKDFNIKSDLLLYCKGKTNFRTIIAEEDSDIIIENIYNDYRLLIINDQNKKYNKTLGFYELLNRGVSEKEILNYYAIKMFSEVANNNKKGFIKLLETKDYLDTTELIVLEMKNYDGALAKYLENHKNIIINWYNKERETREYFNNLEEEHYLSLLDDARQFYYKQKRNIPFKGLIYYIARDLNIIDKVYFYDKVSTKDANLYLDANYFKNVAKLIIYNADNTNLYNQMKKIFNFHLKIIKEEEKLKNKNNEKNRK